MNDMQFSEAEELQQNDADDEEYREREEAEYLASLNDEQAAEFAAFMAEEAEQDAHNEAMRATLDAGLEVLDGFASAEEVAEIAEKYGVTI